VAARCASSPAVFCYDLMNEPVVPGGPRSAGDWLGPPFGGKYHFVQFITLDPAGRPRPEVARQWIRKLAAAIRANDPRRLVTVGLVPWSLDRPGLTSGFVPEAIAPELDFICVHLYPEAGRGADALATLRAFQIGKPVLIEETFPLACPPRSFASSCATRTGGGRGRRLLLGQDARGVRRVRFPPGRADCSAGPRHPGARCATARLISALSPKGCEGGFEPRFERHGREQPRTPGRLETFAALGSLFFIMDAQMAGV
jgi:hypothetical protein